MSNYKQYAICLVMLFSSLSFAEQQSQQSEEQSTKPETSQTNEKMSFGMGLGAIYNGFGLSYGYLSENSYKYGSLGCTTLGYSSRFKSQYSCGVGIGLLRTDFFNIDGNKHAFGAHLGINYYDKYEESGIDYFVAPQYSYFFRGINKAGWHIGATVYIGQFEEEFEAIPSFQFGYQF